MTEGIYPFPDRGDHVAGERVEPATSLPNSVHDDEDPQGREVAGPVLSGEVLDEAGVPVDQPWSEPRLPAWERGSERAPVLAPWLRDQTARRDAARWAVTHILHSTAYYGLRAPLYALWLGAHSPRGAVRLVVTSARWVSDPDGAELVRQAGGQDPRAAARLAELHQATRRSRATRLGTAAAGVVGGFVALRYVGPSWDTTALEMAAVAGLGWAGRRKDRPLIRRAVVSAAKTPRLTSEVVEQALRDCGVKGPVTFVSPITRDSGGWRADIDLPGSVTAAEVIDKREKLSSSLRRPVGAVWPEPDSEQHAGRLVLWVGDVSMSKAKQPAWPLAKSGTVDLFAPFPFATDKRGRWISLTLFESNMLIGALPGAGKTALVRLLALAAGLDPLAEIWVFELYGKGDLSPAEKFAARYGSGMDDETIERALFALRDALDDIQHRAEVLKGLPRDLAPDGKTSRRVAEDRRLGLHPLVIQIDECQNLFQHEDYGREAGELAVKVIRMGRAVGVILILATQRPDKDAIPTGVSALAGIRFCLRVMEQISNDMILGTGMYKAGVKASMLRRSDRGVGWLVGAEDDPLIARSSYQDLKAADRIADRARALRVDAGTLTGYAAGEPEPDRGPRATVLRDLLQVFAGRDKAHSDDLCERLSDIWPERYQGWGPRQLSAALIPFGPDVEPKQVWARAIDGVDRNRYGLELAQVKAAFDRFQAGQEGA